MYVYISAYLCVCVCVCSCLCGPMCASECVCARVSVFLISDLMLILQTLSRSAYIGLNDVEVEGNWTWFDGSAIDEQILLWDNGRPECKITYNITDAVRLERFTQ